MKLCARSFFASLCLALLVLATAAHADAPGKDAGQGPRILILHSYAPDFSWTRELHAGIVSVLQAPEVQARYRVEYMDAKHHGSPDYLDRLLDLYREKYAGTRFDGLLLTDNHALDLAARHREDLFPNTPMAACGINDPASIPANAGDMHIIIENLAHRETLEAALRQNPQTRTIFVIVDDTLTGQFIRQDFLTQTRPLTDRVKIEILPPQTADELVAFARERQPGELLYLLVYFQDAAGTVYTAEEMPRRIAAASPVPMYVAWDFQMDSGAVGGRVTSAFGHGEMW